MIKHVTIFHVSQKLPKIDERNSYNKNAKYKASIVVCVILKNGTSEIAFTLSTSDNDALWYIENEKYGVEEIKDVEYWFEVPQLTNVNKKKEINE